MATFDSMTIKSIRNKIICTLDGSDINEWDAVDEVNTMPEHVQFRKREPSDCCEMNAEPI